MHPTVARLTQGGAVPFWTKRTADLPAPSAVDLHQRYLAPVLNYVAARIGAGAEAEDVTAEVFGAAFAALHKCPRHPPTESEDPVRAWLFGIARRKLADVFRR